VHREAAVDLKIVTDVVRSAPGGIGTEHVQYGVSPFMACPLC
jgi:hypothetical protein